MTGKRMMRAGLLFGGAMLGMGGCLVWTILSAQEDVASGWASLAMLVGFLAVIAASLNLLIIWCFHRCPQCGERTTRLRGQPGEPVLYVCNTCRVEWRTGWTLTRPSD